MQNDGKRKRVGVAAVKAHRETGSRWCKWG